MSPEDVQVEEAAREVIVAVTGVKLPGEVAQLGVKPSLQRGRLIPPVAVGGRDGKVRREAQAEPFVAGPLAAIKEKEGRPIKIEAAPQLFGIERPV